MNWDEVLEKKIMIEVDPPPNHQLLHRNWKINLCRTKKPAEKVWNNSKRGGKGIGHVVKKGQNWVTLDKHPTRRWGGIGLHRKLCHVSDSFLFNGRSPTAKDNSSAILWWWWWWCGHNVSICTLSNLYVNFSALQHPFEWQCCTKKRWDQDGWYESAGRWMANECCNQLYTMWLLLLMSHQMAVVVVQLFNYNLIHFNNQKYPFVMHSS